jgi:starch synthase
MRVLFATSEVAPWVKTGGLGDVAGALPPALRALGIDVQVLVPAYPALVAAFPDRTPMAEIGHPAGLLPPSTVFRALTPGGVPLLMVDCPPLFDRPGGPYQDPAGFDWTDNWLRFGLLSKVAALLASGVSPLDWKPDLLHCNDWQTALAPAYLRLRLPQPAPSVVTIHNLLFQGLFPRSAMAPLDLPEDSFHIDGVEFHGNLSFLKAGLRLCDRITTVSPTYAREIQTPEFGYGLDGLLRTRAADLFGILNGIDEAWEPLRDAYIAAAYGPGNVEPKAQNKAALQRELDLEVDAAAPLFGMVGRLTHQKGLDLLVQIGDELAARGAQLALLGSGEHGMQEAFVNLAERYRGRFAAVIGYNEGLAHRIEAGADIFLMPSRFEPCGLNQMYSLHYGTPPVVRTTGGLADTVVDTNEATLAAGTASGFAFGPAEAGALLDAIDRAIAARRDPATWRRIQDRGMAIDFSWKNSAGQYLAAYRTLVPNA